LRKKEKNKKSSVLFAFGTLGLTLLGFVTGSNAASGTRVNWNPQQLSQQSGFPFIDDPTCLTW
jgi:hypothetical protein